MNRLVSGLVRGLDPSSRGTKPAQTGFTLIELMIALVLGLVVVGSAIAVFLSNRQAYITNTALSNVQDGSRIAFELMARNLRQAGVTGCGNAGRVANLLKDGPNAGGSVDWYADFTNPIVGYDSSQTDPVLATVPSISRVANTDSIQLIGAGDAAFSLAAQSNITSASPTMTLNEPSSNLQSGDIVLVCDPDHAVIMQLSNYSNTPAPPTLTYAANTGTPGNCSTVLSFPTQCAASSNYYLFNPNAQISKLIATDWYVGTNSQIEPNGKKGTSLYRLTLVDKGGVPTPTAQEMVRNVTDLQIMYHQNGQSKFVDAGAVTNWTQVDAVQLTLTLVSTNTRAGTDAKPLQRQFVSTVTLRGRV